MAKRQIALGTIVEADFSGTDPGGTPTYTPIGLVNSVTPPGRPGTEAEGKILTDTLDKPLPGIEGPAEFTFMQWYHPGDAESEKIDAAYNNRFKPAGADGGVVTIRLIYPHGGLESTDTAPTEAFLVNILNIGPEELGEPNAEYKRTVQCRRISDITKGTYTIP